MTACSSANPLDEQDSNSATETGALRPGQYEITIVEQLTGDINTTSEPRVLARCITRWEAAHPEKVIGWPGLSGCSAPDVKAAEGDIEFSMNCGAGRELTGSGHYSSDEWSVSVTGAAVDGGYESTETAKRIGDC